MSDLLRVLSDSELLSRTRELVALERAVTLRLLLHLNEIERRQLHLEQGYSSMFDYCTKGLGYSESAAARRVRAARCVLNFPDVFRMLKANEISLNSVARIARVLSADNKDVLLKRIRSCSQREVEAIVAEYEPREVTRDTIRSVVLRGPATPAAPAKIYKQHDLLNARSGTDAELGESDLRTTDSVQPDCENSNYLLGDGNFDPTPTTVRRVQFHFNTSEEFRQKLDKVRALAWHRLPPNASLENVLELAMDVFIAKHDPIARHERRRQRREVRKGTAPEESSPSEEPARSSTGAPRFIPAAVRDEVFARDGGRCAFVGRDGRRCESKTGLQLDHIIPVARGGEGTADNLRLMCAYHNRHVAARLTAGNHDTAQQ